MRSQEKTKLQSKIHAGRRKKLRGRFLESGLSNFNAYEVLEFALSFCIPRQDTNPAAHSLIEHFGTLPAVLDAKPEDLTKAFGIGENTAVFLRFLKELTTYIAKDNVSRAKIITPENAINFLMPLLHTYTVEQFVVVCIDNAGNVLKVHNITNQELDQVHVNVREIVAVVTSVKTAQVVLAHNHLSEDPTPSVSDIQLTRRLSATFDNLGIKFLDHIIIAGNQDYSFHVHGLLDTFNATSGHKS